MPGIPKRRRARSRRSLRDIIREVWKQLVGSDIDCKQGDPRLTFVCRIVMVATVIPDTFFFLSIARGFA